MLCAAERNKRKKWIHFFDTTDVVVFVASLADYRTFGENGSRRGDGLREALVVFKEVLEDPLLEHATVVLFLNKSDAFRAELQTDWIGNHFSKAPKLSKSDGPDEKFSAALRFVKKKFLRRVRDTKRQGTTTVYEVAATDRANAARVLAAYQSEVLDRVLGMVGEMYAWDDDDAKRATL